MTRTFAAAVAVVALTGCTASPPGAVPPPSPRASASADVRRPRAPVLVYQLRQGREPYHPRAFGPSPRPAPGARGVGERLQVALHELVEGPTWTERRAGYTSAFSRETADVLQRVELRGGRAVVDFHDFRHERPEWSTSYGGSVFLMQLRRTVFQFDRVRSALIRIEGSCRKFWVFLEVVVCETVRRRG